MLTRDSRKRIYRLNKYTSECELNECYTSNDIFIEFIESVRNIDEFDRNIENPKTIEYGKPREALAEYNAGCMSLRNKFRSPHPEDPIINDCDWKTFQIMMKNRVIDDDILETAPVNILRKVYSSLSDEYKRFARSMYSLWTAPRRWTAEYYVIIANYLQFIDY